MLKQFFQDFNEDKIKEISKRINKFIKRTPCVFAHELSELVGSEVYIKLENLQITGGFKIRGNANKLLLLPKQQIKKGVVTASSGNHGLGMSISAKRKSVMATVVVPEKTPQNKIEKLKKYGAKVMIKGYSYTESVTYAKKISQETGAKYISSFDDKDIIMGNSTMGLEIYEDVPEVNTVICPIGGGGGISGIALAFSVLKPSVNLIGVQAEGAAAMMESLKRGKVQKIDSVDTFADGIAVREPGKITFEIVSSIVNEVITVSDQEMRDNVKFLVKSEKVVPEMAGVASVAGLRKMSSVLTGPIVCLISGGNIDLNFLMEILENS